MRIAKLRDGTYFPSLLEPRKRSEKALLAVVQSVSTRKVDDLLRALGLIGIDESKVSRICKELDEVVEDFRNRPLEGKLPVPLPGLPALPEPLWAAGRGSCHQRRPRRPEDRHQAGADCRHLAAQPGAFHTCTCGACAGVRNLLAHIPKSSKSKVAAALRTSFVQPDREAADEQLAEVVNPTHDCWPKAADLVAAAEDDVLAYMRSPKGLRSIGPGSTPRIPWSGSTKR